MIVIQAMLIALFFVVKTILLVFSCVLFGSLFVVIFLVNVYDHIEEKIKRGKHDKHN